MWYLSIIWDDSDDPPGNVSHIAEHGLSTEDVEFVLQNARSETVSRSSGNPVVLGHTEDGRHILVAFQQVDPDTIYPLTAFEVDEP